MSERYILRKNDAFRIYDDNKFYKMFLNSFIILIFALLKSKKPGNNLVKILSIKIIDFAKLKKEKLETEKLK